MLGYMVSEGTALYAVGRLLRRHRLTAGLDLEVAATRVNITPATLSSWEESRALPGEDFSIDQLRKAYRLTNQQAHELDDLLQQIKRNSAMPPWMRSYTLPRSATATYEDRGSQSYELQEPRVTQTPNSINMEPARAFLCHSSGDKEQVQGLYRRLTQDGIHCWFDEEDLLPGQDFDREITKALRDCRHVLACLSRASTTKAGYVQKELKRALDLADEQPEGSIFLIPVRLEPCEVPDRLRRLHWVDLFHPTGYERLLRTLRQG
jgi:hypothetical protein